MQPRFKAIIQKKQGAAVIVAGSSSDREHIKKITDSLRAYGIAHEVRVLSAHKQVREKDIANFLKEYEAFSDCLLAFITVAGGTDALSGTLSFSLPFPVIACAPDAVPAQPNLSCLTNPPGSSNACVIRPENTARFVAQLFAWRNPAVAKKLTDEVEEKIKKLRAADETLRKEMRYEG